MKINRKKLFITLLIIAVVLFVLHLILMTRTTNSSDYWEFAKFFSLDEEVSMPTWYSQTILLFVPALLLFYIGWTKKKTGAKFANHWLALGGVFTFLSLDDGAMIHEKFSTISRLIGLQSDLNHVNAGVFAWSWWVLYVPIFIIIGLFFIKWFLSLPTRTKILFAVALVLFMVGQVGGEVITGAITHNTGVYAGPVWRGLDKFVGKGLGLSLFLWSVVDYIHFMPAKEKLPLKIEVE
ncbi:hypothetical protein FWF48_01685 [Candidatus Saccharibacteria bacterium]|nr:hypothetical protein [Candidatus Saccharibacteria bacterium]